MERDLLAEPLLNQKQVAEQFGLTESFLEARRMRGGGPRFIRISHRCVRYAPQDLREWLAERAASSTSEVVA